MGGYASKTVYVESRNFSGIGERIEWALRYHFRGVIGTIIPILYGSIYGRFKNHARNAIIIANVMTISYFIQPVSIPVTGMFPIFLLPMSGIIDTLTVCKFYFSSNAALIFLGGLMGFLLNNIGLDRRLITHIMTSGKTAKYYKPNILLFKVCIAAFFTSFWGNHIYTSATIYEYLEPVFAGFQIPPPQPKPKKDKNAPQQPKQPSEFQYLKFQHIINQAILVSATLGHLNMIHTSWTLILLRHAFYGSKARGSHQDLFNYLQYMMFSLVFTTTGLCITILYFVGILALINRKRKPISAVNMTMMTNKFMEARKNELAPMRKYQKVRNTIALFLLISSFILFLTRYSPWLSWSIAIRTKNVVYDATVASAFIIILCAFPRRFGFLKIFRAQKRSDVNLKPETALLFWRFVDKAVNYGYFFVMGGSLSMINAFLQSGVTRDMSKHMNPVIDGMGLFLFLLMVASVTVVACNIASPLAMGSAILPFIFGSITGPNQASVVKNKSHLVILVCSLSSSLNYLFPFKNTIAFHRNHLTKTKARHVWPHAIVLSLLHGILLIVLVYFLGNAIWFQPIKDFEVVK